MQVPDALVELVQRFEHNWDAYHDAAYKEAQLRREFLDPLFELLGWDVHNKQGWSEAYKEVIHEFSLSVGGSAKAPDYCFRIGGTPKFLVEAKKPAVNLDENPAPAQQLRKYGWNAGLPLCFLTDFAQINVYDTRFEPKISDGPLVARVRTFRCSDFAKNWAVIYGYFSKEAVLKGSFDIWADQTKGKKGSSQVDEAFLKDLEEWRNELARVLALRNPNLSQIELNDVVQRIIDRIVFLRVCEDRGVEAYGRLKGLQKADDPYARFAEFCRLADQRYNSGLFYFDSEKGRAGAPDSLSLGLAVDGKVLQKIVSSLYYPNSQYDFSIMPVEILGRAYEQFLGRVIRLTPSHRAVVEKKPEVKKSGGVFYTPNFIVNRIVSEVVGALVDGKDPNNVEELRIVDPACGSGSFLLGAYQYLLDWHLEQYSKEPKKWKGRLVQTGSRAWGLSSDERRRILLANVHGVDIDSQAVEVTKLSLLLKVLERVPGEVIDSQLKLSHTRALPDLAHNIKCGNSLLDYGHLDQVLLDDETRRRVNPFDWRAEFSSIFARGGFDAAIGNPPYIRVQTMTEWAPLEVELYKRYYRSAEYGNYDIYVCFIERGLSLLNNNGKLGFIVPNKFLNAKYGESLRGLLGSGNHLQRIIHFGDNQVFENATTYTCLLFLNKRATPAFHVTRAADLRGWRIDGRGESRRIGAAEASASEWIFSVGRGADLFERLSAIPTKLGEKTHLFVGLQTSADDVFVLPVESKLERDIVRPFIVPRGLLPYANARPNARLLFPYRRDGDGKMVLMDLKWIEDKCPNAYSHLVANRKRLESRDGGAWKNGQWYAFGRSQNINEMDAPKLLMQVTAKMPTVAYDPSGLAVTGGGAGPFYGIRPLDRSLSLHSLLALVNSRLFGWFVRKQSTPLRGGYVKYSKQYVETFPLVIPPPETMRRLEELAQGLVAMRVEHERANAEHNRTLVERQITAARAQVDRVVYELYGLTDAEVALVEEETPL